MKQRIATLVLVSSILAITLFVPFLSVKGAIVPCGRLEDDFSTANVDESVPCEFCHFFVLIHNVYDFLVFDVTTPIAILSVAIAGFLWFTSGGSEGRARKAMDIIKWTLLGVIIVFASWLIINFILNAIGPNTVVFDPDTWYNPAGWFKAECYIAPS